MTRLLAVAALAALITGCATPYGMHAPGGMRGMQGAHDMHSMHGGAGMPGHGGPQAQAGTTMGGCMHGMHGMHGKGGAEAMAGEQHAAMRERMREHMQARAEGRHGMCQMGPAGEADAHQH